jgi:hypothetical protein
VYSTKNTLLYHVHRILLLTSAILMLSSVQTKWKLEILVFIEKGKPENPEKTPWNKYQQTETSWALEMNPDHWGEIQLTNSLFHILVFSFQAGYQQCSGSLVVLDSLATLWFLWIFSLGTYLHIATDLHCYLVKPASVKPVSYCSIDCLVWCLILIFSLRRS